MTMQLKQLEQQRPQRLLNQRTGRSSGWAGDVVGHHKTACAFYGLAETGNIKTCHE
ncbi:hypothetical protein VCHA54P496_350015 [Vibrio chagasii]|nr:hypothetical protein VCHA54P496_350015 [Vibrio chagasii]CAH7252087.1 hypothetical protein VCHA54P495_360017 [Vibrio chagasii]CAH7452305.1 hypothetical protein VCHA54P486_400015 [Vibrio chagasii]